MNHQDEIIEHMMLSHYPMKIMSTSFQNLFFYTMLDFYLLILKDTGVHVLCFQDIPFCQD